VESNERHRHDTQREEYDNVRHNPEDSSSDHDDANSSVESEDEEELNGIVLRTYLFSHETQLKP
jgi:hypothetical protein